MCQDWKEKVSDEAQKRPRETHEVWRKWTDRNYRIASQSQKSTVQPLCKTVISETFIGRSLAEMVLRGK